METGGRLGYLPKKRGKEMQIFGLKSCDTCRAARRALPDATFADLREDPLPDAVLDAALAAFGEALVNRSSTTWRGLDDDARARPARDLLRAHPALMKRPLILGEDGALHLGWTAQVRSALGLGGGTA